MPSEAQVDEYASHLHPIYRDILAAYPAIEPHRQAGYGLAFQTLAIHFFNTGKQWSLGDVQGACEKMAEAGIVEMKNGIFAHPTEIGERLIATISGKPLAPTFAIPALPTRTW